MNKEIMKMTLSVKISLAAIGFCFLCGVRPTATFGAGLTDYESMQCSAIRASQSLDATVCADTALPSCSQPDWFPLQPDFGLNYEMNSYLISDTVRYNQVLVRLSAWAQQWDHTWYSGSDVTFGPALPRYGHEWNEYDNAGTLVKSVSCDIRGRFSYP